MSAATLGRIQAAVNTKSDVGRRHASPCALKNRCQVGTTRLDGGMADRWRAEQHKVGLQPTPQLPCAADSPVPMRAPRLPCPTVCTELMPSLHCFSCLQDRVLWGMWGRKRAVQRERRQRMRSGHGWGRGRSGIVWNYNAGCCCNESVRREAGACARRGGGSCRRAPRRYSGRAARLHGRSLSASSCLQ